MIISASCRNQSELCFCKARPALTLNWDQLLLKLKELFCPQEAFMSVDR